MVLINNDPVTEPLNLKFYDATRKLVYEQTIESTVSHIPVTLPKGVYFVYLERNNTVLYERVLVL